MSRLKPRRPRLAYSEVRVHPSQNVGMRNIGVIPYTLPWLTAWYEADERRESAPPFIGATCRVCGESLGGAWEEPGPWQSLRPVCWICVEALAAGRPGM